VGVNAGGHQVQVGHPTHKDVALHVQHGQDAAAPSPHRWASVHHQSAVAALANGADLGRERGSVLCAQVVNSSSLPDVAVRH
jgi:hypothetical protein